MGVPVRHFDAVIVGAGYIGLECAATFRKLGLDVTVHHDRYGLARLHPFEQRRRDRITHRAVLNASRTCVKRIRDILGSKAKENVTALIAKDKALEPEANAIVAVDNTASGTAQIGIPGDNGRGHIKQGFLEASNVNVVQELVDMIETQRAYEINSKMISAVDEMLKNANQTL